MKTIKCMMDHLYWADGRIMDALEESETRNKDLLKLVRHVAVAERVWLDRLQGKGSAKYSLWEETEDLTAIRTMFEENAEQYRIYIEGLKEFELDEMIDYENQSGVSFRTSARDILLQVLLHGQYHRGQINRALRIESAEPAQVDYITFTRL
ncbi:DinB family protein [Paenibacillus sp. CMAA1739]|uniref:DinB family protein n=1 Tax=Paenibacillus ottowii TaxID=2315729 RepID=UPI00273054B8|nr:MULTISPECIES: DinB family protein [Paenibacillus]MDP1509961.1 DinB family protein [Paenibacillus ottowii]MEC4567347.1 DinB family protein [Paenibacillus sp. CMAA1739]